MPSPDLRCQDATARLAEYADDALDPRQRDRVAAHLRACEPCRRELEAHHRAMEALHQASTTPVPDLWAGFQARLEAEARSLSCETARGLLPAYLDADLERERDRAVRRHLSQCAACAAEEALLLRALKALESAPTPSWEAPDLWPAVSSRLADGIACGDVGGLLPAYLAGDVDGGRASRLRAHLDSCTACARELSATQHALAALDRAAEAPAVDLWPQFAARLAEERARVPFWHRWLPQFPAAGLGSLLGHPAARPALGLAAALVAVIAYGTLRPSGTQPAGPQVAIAPAAPETPFRAERPTTAPEAERKNLFPEQPSAPRKSRPAVRQVRRVLVARERTPSRGEPRRRRPASPLLASRPAGPAGARPARVPERRVLIAQSSRLEIPEAADLTAVALPASEVNSEQARAEVTPEVVEVVRLLAGVEDAAARPFGAPFPGQ